jgi:hypothetical protein
MSIPAGNILPHSGIVSVDELRSYMSQINLNPLQESSAAMILMGVQTELEKYLNRPVAPLVGTNGRMLDHLYPVVGDPLIVPGGIYVGVPGVHFVVEYVGGYNGYLNAALKMGIMRVAAREVSVHNDHTLSLRDGNAEQAAQSDNRPTGWTPEELKQFDRLRRRIIV